MQQHRGILPMDRKEYFNFALGLIPVVLFGLLALIPLEVQRSNGRSLHDWFDHPDPEHTCQISYYNESLLFGAMLKNCHCKGSCYGGIVPCRMVRPVLELDPTHTSPTLNYGLGDYCCDKGNCFTESKLYTCSIVVDNITNLSWTWTLTLPDNTTWAQWQEQSYCFWDDLTCLSRARQRHFIGQEQKCWIKHWDQGRVTLSYPGPLAGTIGIFWFLISLSALLFSSILLVILMDSCCYCCKYAGHCFIAMGQECIDCTNAIYRRETLSSSNSDNVVALDDLNEINSSDFERNSSPTAPNVPIPSAPLAADGVDCLGA